MVKLNKIYTRTGDDGSTGLGSGDRVSKSGARVEAYGAVDEANAAIGMALVEAGRAPEDPAAFGDRMVEVLTAIQHDLFDVGADLCIPITEKERRGELEHEALRVTENQTGRIESAIDQHNEALAPLQSFVLPGGSALSAALHMARTVTRRAEREVVRLMETEAETTNPETLRYLNRLSDLLFVLSRVANDQGRNDVLWKPGAHRDGSRP
jgi:cob(I)alamin adenosyltransferase